MGRRNMVWKIGTGIQHVANDVSPTPLRILNQRCKHRVIWHWQIIVRQNLLDARQVVSSCRSIEVDGVTPVSKPIVNLMQIVCRQNADDIAVVQKRF